MGEGSYSTITVKEGETASEAGGAEWAACGSTDSLDSMFRQHGTPETYLLERREVRSPVFAQRPAGARSGNDRCPNEPLAAFATGAGRRESQVAASFSFPESSRTRCAVCCPLFTLCSRDNPTRRPYASPRHSPVSSWYGRLSRHEAEKGVWFLFTSYHFHFVPSGRNFLSELAGTWLRGWEYGNGNIAKRRSLRKFEFRFRMCK